MKALVFYTSTNRKGQHDSSGAFKPEALAFAKIHGVAKTDMIPVPQDIPLWDRRWLVNRVLDKAGERRDLYDAVAYFGHGTTTSLPGMGYPQAQIPKLVGLLAQVLAPNAVIVLYACSAGKGFGFADRLDVALAKAGREDVCTVSHLTAGHVSINPHCEYSGEGPMQWGTPIVAKTSPLWGRWVSALRNNQWFRLSFPFLTWNDIVAQLGGDAAEAPEPGVRWRCPKCGYEVSD